MSSLSGFDYTIIGAGLTGLSLGYSLKQKFPDAKIQIFEKSKGCGGRMATRRRDDWTFDHGAQFIRHCQESEAWIQLWKDHGVAKSFSTESVSGFCGISGMSKLAKVLASSLNIRYETKLTSLRSSNDHWILTTDQANKSSAKNVILTCPLPQSLEILKASDINFNKDLSFIDYAKALVLLIELEANPAALPLYQENVSSDIFSICSQELKGTSSKPAISVVMTKELSESYFDFPEEEVIFHALGLIKARLPAFEFQRVYLKKWRYSYPLKTWTKPWESPRPHLYLAGDAFGGPSLIGALRSSSAVLHQLPGPFFGTSCQSSYPLDF